VNRLHITEITSIGAVEDGDDPEAQILLFKSKSAPEAGGRGVDGFTPSPVARGTSADWGPLIERIRLEKLAEQSAAISKISRMKGQPPMAKREESGRSSAAILAEVDAMASRIQKSAGTGTTKAAAKAEVWRTHPEWQVEVRKAQVRERDQGKGLAARIDRIVKSYCLSISAQPEHMAKTLSQIRNEVMHTAAGIEVKKLRADAMAGKVGSESEVWKSAEYSDAWSILKSWEREK
jgi:hypothetical protein